MPKPKPDQVIRHEIVLGRSERELIEGALVAYQVNKIATPAVALISDNSAMIWILSIISGILGWKYILSPGLENAADILGDWQNQYNAWKSAGGTPQELASDIVIDTITGIPFPGSTPASRSGLAAFLDSLFGSSNGGGVGQSGGGGGGSF